MSADRLAVPLEFPDVDDLPAEAYLAWATGRFAPGIAAACSTTGRV